MKANPGCANFASIATNMLNVDLRPVTAKWHKAHKSGLLDSKDGANEFRVDLAELRLKLVEFSEQLHSMAYGVPYADKVAPDIIDNKELDSCLNSIPFGIRDAGDVDLRAVREINTSESEEINARREFHGIKTASGTDAIGLSLSGGGIRSATFCLGVVQVLAQRNLLKDVDYLSTVSGGGYIGSFITSSIGAGANVSEIGAPYGPDPRPVRHVRQNAKYLSAADLKQRWVMAMGMVAGLLLNWTAPLALLAVLAILGNFLAPKIPSLLWPLVASGLTVMTTSMVLIYGVCLRADFYAILVGRVLALFGAISGLAFLIFLVEQGYYLFSQALAAHWQVSGGLIIAVAGIPALVIFLPLFGRPSIKRIALKLILIFAGGVVPFLAIIIYYMMRVLGGLPVDPASVFPLGNTTGLCNLVAIALGFGCFAFFGLNVNLTGLHRIYREKLAQTFLGGVPDKKLSHINPLHAAPYHIINATINLPSSKNQALRDRRGDFFIFSKHWCGATAVGYSPTKEWEAVDKRLHLSTAMAISGAAASAHMGRSTVPTLSALLTLLNIRLGYWIPRPKSKPDKAPGFSCLLREMTGLRMSEKSDWFNLSDGGHIENMGVYELLRRRCKFVICVDGESDPASTFEGQLTLIRHAQIDFGIRLEPRFDDIRLDPKSQFSRTHFHLFRIHYPCVGVDEVEEIGLMLYLKLSLTGDETEFLKRYRAIHPAFPHQSTLDQFYDEEQFEAYRQLGIHVAEGAFSPALLTEEKDPQNIPDWIAQLARNMLEPRRF
ncbi:Patatin-like phospholipase [Variovorax sp. OK605]|nr:Patatin-like phospholipase [Variovorax sp. OK605]